MFAVKFTTQAMKGSTYAIPVALLPSTIIDVSPVPTAALYTLTLDYYIKRSLLPLVGTVS